MKLLKFFLITSIILILLFLVAYIYPRYIEPNLLTVNQANLESPEIDGHLNIVFFGDTHIGEFNNIHQLDRIVTKINAVKPDLVIFTGDLIGASGTFTADPDAIARTLNKIQAPYGKYGVMGNHEYALVNQYDYNALMNAGGFTVLVNDWLDIPQINVRLLGLDDAYRGSPDKALGNEARAGAYNILMTHEPDIVDQMNHDDVQLIVAGHTHGGQISLPLLTERILPAGGKKYVKGLYAIGGDAQTNLFVTKGTGMTKLPFRFMNVPEIVSIEVGS